MYNMEEDTSGLGNQLDVRMRERKQLKTMPSF